MKLKSLLPLALLFFASWASAQTATLSNGTGTASASIANSCAIASANGVAFGTYNSVTTHKTANLDSTSSLSVRCTNGSTGVKVYLNPGQSPNGSCAVGGGGRYMRIGTSTNSLRYELYRDSGYSLQWGCAAGNSFTLADFTSSTSATAALIYGRVFSGQSAASGSYTDIVDVQVVF